LPLLIIFFKVFLYFIEITFQPELIKLGLYPRKVESIFCIITSPFIHTEFNHLFSNSIAFFVLSFFVFYFYPQVALKILIFSIVLPNTILWLIGRSAYHIGSSGIIYSFASFLFFSGILTKNKNLTAISLIIVFLYGSMIWYMFPINYKISWEGHLSGFITGILLSLFYKDKYIYTIKEKFPDWYFENDNDNLNN